MTATARTHYGEKRWGRLADPIYAADNVRIASERSAAAKNNRVVYPMRSKPIYKSQADYLGKSPDPYPEF